MKIISIVCARPQFIKAALVSKKIRNKGYKELNLPKPDCYLDVGSGSHGEQTGKMLIEIEKSLDGKDIRD